MMKREVETSSQKIKVNFKFNWQLTGGLILHSLFDVEDGWFSTSDTVLPLVSEVITSISCYFKIV